MCALSVLMYLSARIKDGDAPYKNYQLSEWTSLFNVYVINSKKSKFDRFMQMLCKSCKIMQMLQNYANVVISKKKEEIL
jgi:hypothetical protein